MSKLQFVRSTLLSAAVVLPVAAMPHGPALATAGAGQAVHLNGEGRRVCRALAQRPAPYWEAKVRGRFLDYHAGSNRFVVKMCFETRGACIRFAGGIHHVMQGVEVVNYSRCTEK